MASEFHPCDKNIIVTCGKSHLGFWTLEGGTLTKKLGLFEVNLARQECRFYRFPLIALKNPDNSIFQISFTEVRQTEICYLYGIRGEWRLNYWRFQRKYLCMGTRYVLSVAVSK